MIAIYLKLYY